MIEKIKMQITNFINGKNLKKKLNNQEEQEKIY